MKVKDCTLRLVFKLPLAIKSKRLYAEAGVQTATSNKKVNDWSLRLVLKSPRLYVKVGVQTATAMK